MASQADIGVWVQALGTPLLVSGCMQTPAIFCIFCVLNHCNNGSADPMRPDSFSTIGTAFPGVPRQNDPSWPPCLTRSATRVTCRRWSSTTPKRTASTASSTSRTSGLERWRRRKATSRAAATSRRRTRTDPNRPSSRGRVSGTDGCRCPTIGCTTKTTTVASNSSTSARCARQCDNYNLK